MKSTLPRTTGPSYGPEHDEHLRALEPRSKSDGARPLFGFGTAEDRLGTELAVLRDCEKRKDEGNHTRLVSFSRRAAGRARLRHIMSQDGGAPSSLVFRSRAPVLHFLLSPGAERKVESGGHIRLSEGVATFTLFQTILFCDEY